MMSLKQKVLFFAYPLAVALVLVAVVFSTLQGRLSRQASSLELQSTRARPPNH